MEHNHALLGQTIVKREEVIDMLRFIAILFVLFLGACGQTDLEQSQGHTNRQDVMNMGLENRPSPAGENPRSIERVGDTWGQKEDRNQIREAAHTIEGVEVERIIIQANDAWVTVSATEDLTEEEKQEWIDNVKETIQNAVPDYNVTVKVQS